MTRLSYDPRKSANQANRGMELEDMVQNAIDYYNAHKIALIQKVPTPIRPVDVNYRTGVIHKAFFEKKSTVDYIGCYQGFMLAFDAKENSVETNFPLSNVKDHQYEFLKRNHNQGGLSFLIVSFTGKGEIYYLPFELLNYYWEYADRESIPYSEFKEEIVSGELIRVDFLKNILRQIKGD